MWKPKYKCGTKQWINRKWRPEAQDGYQVETGVQVWNEQMKIKDNEQTEHEELEAQDSNLKEVEANGGDQADELLEQRRWRSGVRDGYQVEVEVEQADI